MKVHPQIVDRIIEALKGCETICVVGHVRPDGDCVGSQLGLTLALWLGMAAQLWIVGVRRPRILILLPTVTAAAVCGLFIVLLDSSFPHGPIESLLVPLLGRT